MPSDSEGLSVIKVAAATLGCKVNQYETAAMVDALPGVSIVPFDETADVYIINTCSVTAKTDYQSRQLIRRAARRNPEATVIVTGCYAQRAPEEISRIPGVTIIAGNAEKDDISKILRGAVWGKQQILVGSIQDRRLISNLEATKMAAHTRAFLKIQDGCDAHCSYCIVPHTRGPGRSLPEQEVVRRVASLVARGYIEVVLTGIHLGAYGKDLNPPSSLTCIVGRIIRENIIGRLRLSSIEPVEVTDELVEMIRDSGVLCRHLHIPLQSGDDRILSAMNRNYDVDFFRSLLAGISSAIPDTSIGIDIMVGFPGEDEEAFDHTRRFVESLPVTYFHVFPYSRRPGTPAWDREDHIPEGDKKNRAEILRQIGRKKKMHFMDSLIGKPLSVLIESGTDRLTGYMKGLSDHYMPISVINGDRTHENRIVRVVPERIQGETLVGKIVGHHRNAAGLA